MRRMVNTKVTDLDMFLDMPATSRLLYYDLLTRADDDGFITPKRVMRMTGAAENDLGVLIAKQFVYAWEDGVVVLLHWRDHNHVKSDRYVSSDFFPRLKDLKGIYVMGAREDGTKTEPKRVHSGSKVVPQDRVGKGRLGEVRIEEVKPIQAEAADASPPREAFISSMKDETRSLWLFWEETFSEITGSLEENRSALNKILSLEGSEEKARRLILLAAKAWTERYAPKEAKASSPAQLWQKRGTLLAWGKGQFSINSIPVAS